MSRIPLEDFFRKPERAGVTISPDGTHVAFLAPWERRMNVHVQELATGRVLRLTEVRARDVGAPTWAGPERLVHAQDTGGDENWRFHSVSRDGSGPRDLTPWPAVQARLVDDLPGADDSILLGLNRRDPQLHDVFRVDVRTGGMTLVAENPGSVSAWLADHEGRVRAATTTDGVNTSILVRPDESAPWRTVATHGFRENAAPLMFTGDDRGLHVATNVGRPRRVLASLDLATGREGAVLFEHPEVDVSELRASHRRRVPTCAWFETDRPSYAFLDAQREAVQRQADAALPGRLNTMTSASYDETRWVVHSWSDRTPGSYHLLDVPTGRVTKLFESAPWLDEQALAPMEPVSYRARDGRRIPAYLTLPRGASGRLPLVVNPHGGPWMRDSWGYNPEVQFLASRGFAVLQPNYRGSTGYGRDHVEAGFGQWGLAMTDDLEDGVRWALAEGFADPARVAVYGGSYGGFAALSSLVRTPDLYRCGVSLVGVSNLFTWLDAFPPYWKPYLEMVHEMVGHPERDAERLRAASPCFNAERIRVPLLVAQGANDPRVKKAESDQIVGALRARGVEVEYMVKDDEGHGFLKEENRFDFYRTLEAFLLRHLG